MSTKTPAGTGVPDNLMSGTPHNPPLAVPSSPLRLRSSRKRAELSRREVRGLRRADALVASGQVDKALAHLRKLISAVPESVPSYLRIAALLREVHRSAEAVDILKAAIKTAPTDPDPREILAEICLEMGLWDEAIQQGQALLALSPRSLFARDVLSASYLQRGLIEQALRVTDEMIVLDPMDPANHFKRGVLLQQKGYIGGAIRAFLRVLELDGESEVAEESRAAIEMLDSYQLRQIVTLAVEDMRFRLNLRQNCGRAVESRGYLLSERGMAALSQVRFDDLPAAPPGWRQFHYH